MGKPAELRLFEKGKVVRTEINLVKKMLKFRAQNGVNLLADTVLDLAPLK